MVALVMGRIRAVALVCALSIVSSGALVACSSDGSATPTFVPGSAAVVLDEPPVFVGSVRDAIAAVEDARGGPQQFFEVTANARVTNVFVAVEEGTAAVPYAYVDGELEPPAPEQDGASGKTFVAADVAFDPELLLSGVAEQLPTSRIDAISVYGDGAGATYVLAVTSRSGGSLDVVVGPEGEVLSVDPV